MIIKKVISSCVLMMSLVASTAFTVELTIVDTTISPFFDALKNGDVNSIEAYIDDPLYSEIKVLLHNNQGYPDFLRQRYANSYLEIINIVTASDDHKIVYIDIHFSPTGKQSLELQLNKAASGTWKITEQAEISQ